MSTRARARALLFLAKTLLFWAKNLLIRAKIFKAHETELLQDQISQLPDDIIVHIISLLTMKEAGRTSVLSKRWRYVWAYIPVLNFDASDTMEKLMLSEEEDLLEKEKPRYLSWVNQVVRSYKGSTIDEFRVQFDISATSQNNIDNWIKFALEKRVKMLELDFKPHEGGGQDIRCTFNDLSFFNSLTSLQLTDIDVTGKVLQNFLNSCPGLEYLFVQYSESLESLEVSGPTLNLKYLEIIYCLEIKHIEIYAPNLVSFKYFGPKISMPLKWTPKLAELSIGGKYGIYLTNNFLEISSHLSQLEVLRLDLRSNLKYVMKSVDQFPRCEKLKELEIKVNPEFDESLFCLVPLLKACPNLHKFVLKFYWTELSYEGYVGLAEAFPLGKLKVVEVAGFLGHEIDTEFIVYLIENSVALEKIIINPFKITAEGTPWEFLVEERQIKARKQAEQLRTKLKRGIDLIIL